MKLFRLLFLGLLCAIAMPAFSQLNIGTVDPGPYSPGSSIAATFSIDPSACIAQGNSFELWLSDATGNFATETRIGSFNSFYTTFVNGKIPTTVAAGSGYRVRIKSTNPAYISNPSSIFEIKAGTAVEAKLTSTSQLANPNPEVFGLCDGINNNEFFLTNASTATSNVTATVKNELNGSISSLSFTTVNQSFNAQLAHYTVFVKAIMPDLSVGTKAYQVINNVVNTPFGTSGNNIVCLPLGFLEFNVIVDGPAGIRQNFPGNIYRVDWGDGTSTTHTICDIIQNNGKVKHPYTKSSCGVTGTGGTFNAFDVIIRSSNIYCGNIGTAVSSTAKVVVKPVNSFNFNPTACTNAKVLFTNTSILGENPNTATPGCAPNNVLYNWFVDGIPIAVGKPRNYVFEHVFTTNGKHTIRLTSSQTGTCTADPIEQEICIQNPPQPIFTLDKATICAPDIVKITNSSVIDNICNTGNTYTWAVTGPGAFNFVNGTNASSAAPEIRFTSRGIYQLTLAITTASCGTVTSAPQQIVVNETPTSVLSADAALCSVNTYDFNPTTTGPTRTVFTGTALDLSDTYTWNVAGGAHNFIGGNLNTKYPKIQFLDYGTYTITATHTNTCGTVTDTQVISFTPAPTVDAGPDQNICYNETNVTLAGSITGAVTSQVWVGGTGAFSPNRNALNATYTPSTAEKNAGIVTLTLRATTTLPSPCNSIDNDVIINIKPRVIVNSDNSKSICTGANVAYIPTSASGATTTFAWTATGTPNATGFTASGTGNITDVLTNTDLNANAIVTYVITPTYDGCTGDPFTLIVTVTPNPILTAIPARSEICSGQNTAITLSSNLGASTRYTWTSTATAGVTGNSNRSTSATATIINDQIFNSGTVAGTVTYTITPISANECTGNPVQVVINIEPLPSAPNAGADQSLCNLTSYTLQGNQPSVGTGLWTQVTSFGGINFADASLYNTEVSGLQAGNTYVFRWTITGSASCDPQSDDVRITITPLSFGGTTAGTTAVCAGVNSGQVTLSGQIGNIIKWQSSTDGTTWTDINNTTSTLTYINLTISTQYRAIVQSGTCASAISTPSVITVNQPVIVANAGTNQRLCAATSTTLNGNLPTPNNGQWSVTSGQTGVTFNDASLPNAIVNGLVPGQTYTFTWTISGSAPCPPSTSNVIVQVDLPSNGGTAGGTTAVCAGTNNGNITLTGHVGTIVGWSFSTDGGTIWTPIANTSATVSYLNLSSTTQYRAEVKNGPVCTSVFSTIATVTVNQGAIGATVGANQTLCNATSTTLSGNSPLTNTGLWTQVSGPAGAVITDQSLYNTTVTGLIGGATYVFRWTISGLAPCPATSAELTIVNLAELQNNIITTPTTTNCNGKVITLAGSTPTGGNNIYTYVWETSPTGTAPWTVITGQTGISLNVTVNASLSYRRTVNSGVCSAFSNVINITALPSITGNTIGTSQVICLGNTPSQIIGTEPTGGDGTNYSFSWEQSTDNGSTWAFIAGANGKDYAPIAITQTTIYRRLVSSGACTGAQQSISNAITITVNLNARAEFTWNNDLGCIPFVLDANNIKAVAYPTRNATYNWYANNVLIGSGINFPGFSITTENTNVIIKLVVTSSLGCLPDEMSHTFSTRQNILASYTQSATSGCGPLSVTFNNTTSAATGVSFQWAVDNNPVSAAANPGTLVFLADPAGEDKIYTVSLKATTPCGSTTSTSTITVKANPIAAFSPSKTIGCSPLTVVFTNTSPGNSNSYSYDFDDGTTSPATTNKGTVTHTFTTDVVRDFEVKMTATNECGTDTKPIIIRVSPNTITPALIVNGNQMRGCAPFTVNFINNTKGASKFTYTFEPGVIVTSNTFLPETRPYAFNKAGTYTVNLLAENNCSTASTQVTIVVDPQPTVTFTASNIVGCKGMSVKFDNTTIDAVSYLWNFGDGQTSAEKNPTHIYNAPAGTYTVSLTAVNSLGCPQTVAIANYIKIVAPPIADFNIAPAAVISIPEYTFKFTDVSTNGAQTYKWSFGDGVNSSLKDPTHKYADTGKYLVTMRTFNEYGCVDSVQKSVQIVGVPGYVYLPNSFIPGGTSSPLQKFMAVGSGIKSWKMQILNKWGQVIWETSLLNDGKPVDGWDGMYKGVPQPQGIYFWKLDVELINGTEWKGMTYDKKAPRRTGEIYLIR